MNDASKPEYVAGHGGYERQDLKASGVIGFFVVLGLAVVACVFGLRVMFTYLDHLSRTGQPPVNPLVEHVPADTRHVPRGYPQGVFPSPQLEEDERGQLNSVILQEEQKLNSYGWVDEPAGVVHIPIDRAMDLLVQKGLPVRAGEKLAAGAP
ncbi:MAG TPA: hypothetical protein VND65_18790 [Candidatus Binatia bacterium]|nr:hypothetical protein [Candidatus Binatia bacterium]